MIFTSDTILYKSLTREISSLDLLIPTSELYTKDRVSFVNPIEGAKQFETAA